MQSYQLHITLKQPVTLQIGKLGLFEFPAGQYIYTGSAKTNIQARVQRHLRCGKKMHWHIDYLLAAPLAEITAAELFEELECALNQRTPGQIIVRGFGSTDCRNGCGSHLKFLGTI
ncbi:GIY-YIG nuclease family protein [candidate division KSB1 bacterium]|nr:GIY-YIG nuclease family protein [candidate division KSB1 bacterium]